MEAKHCSWAAGASKCVSRSQVNTCAPAFKKEAPQLRSIVLGVILGPEPLSGVKRMYLEAMKKGHKGLSRP